MAESQHRSFFASYPEALLIAILTAGMYWASFVYEVAYLTSYGLPIHLIEVNLHTMFLLVPIMTALAIWIIIMSAVLQSLTLPLQRKVYRILVILFFPMAYIATFGLRTEDWWIYISLLVGIALFELAWPILLYRDLPTLEDKFIAQEHYLKIGVPVSLSVLIVVFLMGTYNAYIYGRRMAQRQTSYLVFDDDPDVAVIRVYNDTILAVPFDRKTRTVKSQVVIRKIGSDSSIRLTYVNVGPLTLPSISITLTVS